jgi:hypothetical protein
MTMGKRIGPEKLGADFIQRAIPNLWLIHWEGAIPYW